MGMTGMKETQKETDTKKIRKTATKKERSKQGDKKAN